MTVCAYRPPFTLFPEALPHRLEGRYRELELADLTPSQAQDMAVSLLGGGSWSGTGIGPRPRSVRSSPSRRHD